MFWFAVQTYTGLYFFSSLDHANRVRSVGPFRRF